MGNPKWDNYALAAQRARELFLGYDQEKIIAKLGLRAGGDYLYIRFLDLDYRIRRQMAAVEKREGDGPWRDGEEFPAQLNLLWDANTTAYLHYETVYYLTDFLLGRLETLLERADAVRGSKNAAE